MIPHPKILKEVKDDNWTVVFLHRDPKDIIVSMKYHNNEREVICSPYCGWEKSDYDRSDGILWLIENTKPWYDHMMEWTEHATHVIEYEQLINMPHPNIFKVTDALGLDRASVMKHTKDKVGRYRTGKSGNWKTEFKEHHIEAYERIWGNV